MDLVGGLGARCLDETEDLAGRLVEPVAQVPDVVLALDREVGRVGGGDAGRGQALDVMVGVEIERRRVSFPLVQADPALAAA